MPAAVVAALVAEERVLHAVRVAQPRQRARRHVAHGVAVAPQGLLVRERQRVAVVVAAGVGVERVRVRPLAGVGQVLVRVLVLVVVEVLRRLELVAVLDAVAVAVGVARHGADGDLGGVGEQIVVVVRVEAVLDAVLVAVAVGALHDLVGGRHRPGDDRGELGAGEPLAEARGEDAQAEDRRHGVAGLQREELLERRRDLHPQHLLRAHVRLGEHRTGALALEHHGVLRTSDEEVAAADRQRLADCDVLRRDRGDPRRLLLLRLGMGVGGGQPRRGGGEQGHRGGREAGAAQVGADAGSEFHRAPYRRPGGPP